METEFDEAKPPSVSAEEATAIKALIRRTLQYDADKRPTASELLQDPWFLTNFDRAVPEEVFLHTYYLQHSLTKIGGEEDSQSLSKGT